MNLTYQVVTAIAACIFAAVWLLARARASSSKNGTDGPIGFGKAWILQEEVRSLSGVDTISRERASARL